MLAMVRWRVLPPMPANLVAFGLGRHGRESPSLVVPRPLRHGRSSVAPLDHVVVAPPRSRDARSRGRVGRGSASGGAASSRLSVAPAQPRAGSASGWLVARFVVRPAASALGRRRPGSVRVAHLALDQLVVEALRLLA